MRGGIGIPCTDFSRAPSPPSGKAELDATGLHFRAILGFPTVGLKTVNGKPLELKSGKWYYEVTIGEGDLIAPQFGWCDSNGLGGSFEIVDEDGNVSNGGVGDSASSWGIDGSERQSKCHKGESEAYDGEEWEPGDVVGFMADLDEKKLSFSLNGELMGVAFECIEFEGAMFPALSASGCDITCNFGARMGKPLQNLPEDYLPVVAASVHEQSAKLVSFGDSSGWSLFSGKATS